MILNINYLPWSLSPSIITLNVVLYRFWGAFALNSDYTLDLCGELLKMLVTRPCPWSSVVEFMVGPGFEIPKTSTGDSDDPGLRGISNDLKG